jgi:hypothetical protein
MTLAKSNFHVHNANVLTFWRKAMPARKPTKLLDISGAFKKNPQRRRDAEPTSSGPLGDPPERLPEAALPFWHELVAMAPTGVLQQSDRWAVELAARLMCKTASEPPPAARSAKRGLSERSVAANAGYERKWRGWLGQD